MKIFGNSNRAKQIYGEILAKEAMNNGINNQYIYVACKFHNDGKVSIIRITDFEQMKILPFAIFWCIKKAHWWKDYKEKEPPAEFLLITNKNYTEESNCMYVMIEMYSNGNIGYWSTDNELIDETNSSGRLPTLKAYQSTLGNGLSVIEQERKRINNQQNINENDNMNKNRIRLTESQLHRVIKESVNNILSEMSGNDIALINGSCGDNTQTFIEYLEEMGLPENDALIYRGHLPQQGNWLHGIQLLKKANAWNEQTKAEYKAMIDGFFERAKYSYEAGLRVLQ